MTPEGEINPYAVSEATLNLAPQLAEASPELAGRGRRLVAYLIDATIVSLVSFGVQMLFGFVSVNHVETNFSWGWLALYFAIFYGSFVLVNGYTLQTRGQTIGKLLLGIRIVDAKSGELVGLPKILALRELLQLYFPFAIPFIGILYALVDTCFIFNADRRCLHDLIAGTKVVKVTP